MRSKEAQRDSLVKPFRPLPELEVLIPESKGDGRTPRPPDSWQVVVALCNDGTQDQVSLEAVWELTRALHIQHPA